eukprot:SAG31_NODE_13002_length_900_cov_1.449438_2_plen_141_part_00
MHSQVQLEQTLASESEARRNAADSLETAYVEHDEEMQRLKLVHDEELRALIQDAHDHEIVGAELLSELKAERQERIAERLQLQNEIKTTRSRAATEATDQTATISMLHEKIHEADQARQEVLEQVEDEVQHQLDKIESEW